MLLCLNHDIFHDAVKKGLEKEGWLITNDLLRIEVGDVEMYVDLGAEQVLAAEKETEKIAVELKVLLVNLAFQNFIQPLDNSQIIALL